MRFTKLHAEFWSNRASRTIKAAGPLGFQTYLYLQSCPMSNYIGIYYLNRAQACLDLGMTEDELMGYVAKFVEAGFMKYDAENEILWCIEAAEDNIGEMKAGDKRVVALRKDFAEVPKKSPLRKEFYDKYASMLKLEQESFGSQEQTTAQAFTATVSADMVEFEAVVKLLVLRRTMNRAEYPSTGDQYVAADARALCEQVGAKSATVLVMEAIALGDLELFDALGRNVAATPEKATAVVDEADI